MTQPEISASLRWTSC